MNPLIWKIGIPVAIVAAIAFMRWTNSKATGEPFFPGVGDDSKSKGGGGGGGAGLAGLKSIFGSGEDNALTSPNEVQDSGTYSEYSDSSTPVADTSSTSDNTVSSAVTGAGAGTGVAGSGIPAMSGGRGVGGVVQPSAPVAAAILASTTSPYTGGYQPYSPTPTPAPPLNQFGGGMGGRTFAI